MRRMIAFAALLVLVGCQKGEDGKSTLALDWAFVPNSVAMEAWPEHWNAPSSVGAGEQYDHDPGTWYIVYEAWDTSVWDGFYTVKQNKGGEPQFFPIPANGEDGEDTEVTLYLSSFGLSIFADVLNEDLMQGIAQGTSLTLGGRTVPIRPLRK